MQCKGGRELIVAAYICVYSHLPHLPTSIKFVSLNDFLNIRGRYEYPHLTDEEKVSES